MPRSNRKKKKLSITDPVEQLIDKDPLLLKEQVSSYLKKAKDCPIPRKRRRLSDEESSDQQTKLSDDELKTLKDLSKKRKSMVMECPKLFLIESYKTKEDPRMSSTTLSIEDVQMLVLHGFVGQHDSTPSFCKLLRPTKVAKVAILVLHGVSEECFQANSECFSHIQKHYDLTASLNPDADLCLVDGLCYTPLSKVKIGKLKANLEDTEETAQKISKFPGRTQYVLSHEQLGAQNFPTLDQEHIVSTNHSIEVTNSSPLIGLDCEMCTTTKGTELTRVSLVNESGECIYNTYVKPKNPIVDYVTRYSGITKEILDPITTTLDQVQNDICPVLPHDAILVGQSIENDLRALKMYHPHIIDTSRLFTRYPVALRKLVKFYLSREIQQGAEGHDSLEDAVASLDLVKLKIKHGTSLKPYLNDGFKAATPSIPMESIFTRVGSDKVFMMIDSDSITKRLYKEPVGCIRTSNDAETRKKAAHAVSSSQFLWVQYHNYRTYLEGTTRDEQVQQKILKKLDLRVKKIYKALPEKSLVITMMLENTRGYRGSSEDNSIRTVGRVFAEIKVSPAISRDSS